MKSAASRVGLVLFAHGARDPRWSEPFERLRRKVESARPGITVRLAYLELMTPDLTSAVAELVGAGCASMRIVPVFLGQGGHVRQDLPALVQSVSAMHPEIAIDLVQAVGENDAVLDGIAAVCVAGLPA
ncbi:MAG: CbiX/SirB N-terminal domain-containing protein [Casimicrobiaceae bacterium]